MCCSNLAFARQLLGIVDYGLQLWGEVDLNLRPLAKWTTRTVLPFLGLFQLPCESDPNLHPCWIAIAGQKYPSVI